MNRIIFILIALKLFTGCGTEENKSQARENANLASEEPVKTVATPVKKVDECDCECPEAETKTVTQTVTVEKIVTVGENEWHDSVQNLTFYVSDRISYTLAQTICSNGWRLPNGNEVQQAMIHGIQIAFPDPEVREPWTGAVTADGSGNPFYTFVKSDKTISGTTVASNIHTALCVKI